MVKLTCRHGTSEYSAIGYGAIAVVLGPAFHRFADGEAFARLSVASRRTIRVQRAKGGRHFLTQMAVLWTRPIEDASDLLEASIRSVGGNRRDGLRLLQPSTSPHRSHGARRSSRPGVARVASALDFVANTSSASWSFLSIQGFVQSLRGGVGSGAPSTRRRSKRGCSGAAFLLLLAFTGSCNCRGTSCWATRGEPLSSPPRRSRFSGRRVSIFSRWTTVSIILSLSRRSLKGPRPRDGQSFARISSNTWHRFSDGRRAARRLSRITRPGLGGMGTPGRKRHRGHAAVRTGKLARPRSAASSRTGRSRANWQLDSIAFAVSTRGQISI